jgi:hypothetical protein
VSGVVGRATNTRADDSRRRAFFSAVISTVTLIANPSFTWKLIGTTTATYVGTGSLRSALVSAGTAIAFNEAGVALGDKPVARVVAHGVIGGVSAAASGGDFARGFASASFTKLVSPAIYDSSIADEVGTILAGVVSGVASEITGGSFGAAAVRGALGYAFNQTQGNPNTARPSAQQKTLVNRVAPQDMTEKDELAIELAEKGINKVREAIRRSRDPDKISSWNKTQFEYNPNHLQFRNYPDAQAFRDPARPTTIVIGSKFADFANNEMFEYHNMSVFGGGNEILWSVIAHEVGHVHTIGMPVGNREVAANNFARDLLRYASARDGIDKGLISIPRP